MKVTLLGTSSAEGWPGLFCRCDACAGARRLGGKNLRSRSSALIDNRLKLDLPPDILHQVFRFNIDLSALSSILFTHSHDDHFSPSQLQYRGDYFVPSPIVERLPIYGPKDVIQRILRSLIPDCLPITLHVLEPWETVKIQDGYYVTPVLANHDPTITCYNYIIEDSTGAKLLYATDTGWYSDETWRFLQGTQLHGVVVECTKGWEESGYSGHLSIPEVIRMRQQLVEWGCISADCPIACTHFSHLCGMMHDELDAALKPFGIQAGYDGMSLVVQT